MMLSQKSGLRAIAGFVHFLALGLTMSGNAWSEGGAKHGPASLHARDAALTEVVRATLKYQDVQEALNDGFISTVDLGAGCISAPMEGMPSQLGAMGIHFVRLDRLLDETLDFTQPSVLVYVPDPDGNDCTYSTGELMESAFCRNALSLAVVEEIIFADAWPGYQQEPPMGPSFLGQDFYYLHDNPDTPWVDEAHGFPPHYEMHVWLYRHNPAGLFAAWNPDVTCPASSSGMGH